MFLEKWAEGRCRFYLQDEEKLNKLQAWTVEAFPQSTLRYFRDGGCVITSLFNMFVSWGIETFTSPWELHELCVEKNMYNAKADIVLSYIDRVAPVRLIGREKYSRNRLTTQLAADRRCLLKVNGTESEFHYILVMPDKNASDADGMVLLDPKRGITDTDTYDTCYETIIFSLMQ